MWNDQWEVMPGSAARGGQGEVLAVLRRSDGVRGALKRMHNDHLRIRERRARVLQEVTALRALDGRGCPRVIETNAERWETPDVSLYVIMEWVEGPTLTHQIDRGSLTLDEAVSIARQLLRIVGDCHELGIFHRDLKPDNVIVNPSAEPVLVDFGMSWSKPQESITKGQFETPIGQEIGNRFLRLPEHAAGRHEYHPASDVTMVVGLLFYMLTQQAPRIPSDASGAMPHERYASFFAAEITSDPRWPRLRRIFDVGFQSNLNLRFASVDEVLSRLDNLQPPASDDLAMEVLEELAKIRQITNSERGRQLATVAPVMLDASQRYLSVHHGALGGTGFVSGGGGPNLTDGNQAVELQFFLSQPDSAEQLSRFRHSIHFESGQFTATVQVEQELATDYYCGPAADAASLIEAVEAMAPRVIVKLLRYARERLEARYK